MTQTSIDRFGHSYFTLSHWGKNALMTLLVIAFAATVGHAIWLMAQPESVVSGVVVEVTEASASGGGAVYELGLSDEQGQMRFVRLRNNGRILRQLTADVEEFAGRLVTVNLRGELAESLAFEDDFGPRIRESRLGPTIQLLIGLFPMLILLFHVRPGL